MQCSPSTELADKELEQIFPVGDRGGAPCHQVRKLGTEKLRLIESQIENLKSRHRELKKTLAKWDQLLKHTPHAGLLEVLAHSKEKNS